MYSDTVTLFNRCGNRLGAMWHSTVLRNVNLDMDKSAIVAKYGPDSKDSAVLNVHYTIEDLGGDESQCKQIPWLQGKKIVIADKIWLPSNQWRAQVNDALPGTITFEGGNSFDFFWFGEWTGASVISDDDYSSDEGFYGYMNRTWDYVFAITAVGGPYNNHGLLQHFEIMGR